MILMMVWVAKNVAANSPQLWIPLHLLWHAHHDLDEDDDDGDDHDHDDEDGDDDDNEDCTDAEDNFVFPLHDVDADGFSAALGGKFSQLNLYHRDHRRTLWCQSRLMNFFNEVPQNIIWRKSFAEHRANLGNLENLGTNIVFWLLVKMISVFMWPDSNIYLRHSNVTNYCRK